MVVIKPPLGPRRDGAFDLGGIARVDQSQLHSKQGRYRLDCGKLANAGWVGRIPKDGDSPYTGRDLLEQL